MSRILRNAYASMKRLHDAGYVDAVSLSEMKDRLSPEERAEVDRQVTKITQDIASTKVEPQSKPVTDDKWTPDKRFVEYDYADSSKPSTPPQQDPSKETRAVKDALHALVEKLRGPQTSDSH